MDFLASLRSSIGPCAIHHSEAISKHLILIIGIAIVSVGLPDDRAQGQFLAADFCRSRVVRDYERPFKDMPKVHPPPSSGQLPFAPPHTHLGQPSDYPILVPGNIGAGDFGYDFSVDPSSKHRTFHLNWKVTARLVEINNRGTSKRILYLERRKVRTLTDIEFGRLAFITQISPRQAFYRFDLIFKTVGGKLLAKYGQYLRVIRPQFNARLTADRTSFQSGESMLFRLENLGTQEISFDKEFSLEKYQGGMWSKYPVALGPWHRIAYSLGPGQAGKCQAFAIPNDLPGGRYRIKKQISINLRDAGSRKRRYLTAEFDVLP